MWVDDQGVCHTVALPDPTMVMSEVFRASIDRLLAESPDAVVDAVEVEEERFFEEEAGLVVADADNGDYVEVTPPVMLMTEAVATVGDLHLVIQAIDRRWRLDAVMALDDYIS